MLLFMDLRIAEGSFSDGGLHSAFDQFTTKNYFTSINYNFWCHQPYKVQIHISVRKIYFPLSIVFNVIKELINNNLSAKIHGMMYVTVT
jgi:hypothetical protein